MTKDDKTPKPDAPVTEQKANPELNISKGKMKKNKKKKKHVNKSASSASSSSLSEAGSSPPPLMEESTKEKFYDAHESYHGLKDNPPTGSCPASLAPTPPTVTPTAAATPVGPAVPAITTTLLVAQSEQDLKVSPSRPSTGTIESTGRAQKAPSTITKPVTGPE